MQGQGRNITTNPGLNQHKVDSDNASDRNRNGDMNWIGQSSSIMNTQNQIRYVQLLNEDADSPIGTDQGHQRTQSETGQARNGSSLPQRGIFSDHINNIDLNATYEGHNPGQGMGAGISLNPSKPSGAETDQSQPGFDPTNPVLISSGISGYVLEENDGRQGNLFGGRRLSCKRRAPESSFGPLLLRGSSSSSMQQARNSDQQAVIAQENSGNNINVLGALNYHQNVSHLGQFHAGLGVGMGAGSARHQTSSMAGAVLGDGISAATFNHQSSSVAANGLEIAPFMHQTSNVARYGLGAGLRAAFGTNQTSIWAGRADHFQRNIRLRRNANQQSFEHDYLTMWNSHETDMFYDPFDDLLLGRNFSALDLPAAHSLSQVPGSLQTREVFQGVPMSRASGSSTSSAHAVNGGYNQHQEEILRSRILPSGFERGNLSHPGTNMNFGFHENARNGSNSNIRLPSAPTWFSNPNIAHLYSNRYVDTGRRLESRGQGNVGNVRTPQSELSLRARLMPRDERTPVVYHDPHPVLRSLTPARRRSMIISGVHNTLTLVRRRRALRFEDVIVIDHSVLLPQPEDEEDDDNDDYDDDDVHEDLRLDVDNMSYEELLALEEHIGIVNTGLTEEAILAHLRLRKHQPITVGSPVNNEPCCICQEEYADGEDLGKLDCGHDFHANCIKQWLMLKNVCPICKLAALAGRKREH